jgi:hypothetical protein
VKASIIYNDFDRGYYEEIVSESTLLISQSTDLKEYVQNEWYFKNMHDGQMHMIKSNINRFLDRFLKGTQEDYLIKDFDLSQILKAKGYLVFIRDEFKRALSERTPMDIISR